MAHPGRQVLLLGILVNPNEDVENRDKQIVPRIQSVTPYPWPSRVGASLGASSQIVDFLGTMIRNRDFGKEPKDVLRM